MRYLVNSREMKQYDNVTTERFGMPSIVLMERAATAFTEELCRQGVDCSRVLVACGSGNNGGDGYAIARLLLLEGCDVCVLAAGDPDGASAGATGAKGSPGGEKVSQAGDPAGDSAHATGAKGSPGGEKASQAGDPDGASAGATGAEGSPAAKVTARATDANRLQRRIFEAYGGRVISRLPEQAAYTAVIDAVFGVGLSRKIEGIYAEQIGQLNGLSGTKIAVDIASGIADSGAVLGTAFLADLTVTFAFEKLGAVLWPGNTYSGRVIVRDIGITEHSFGGERPQVAALEHKDLIRLPAHVSHSNKGSYGKLLLVAGSAGMAGAAFLGAKAAYCTGCGLVRIVTPEENRVILQTGLPEAVLTTYPADHPVTEDVAAALEWADVIVCGPGLGTSPAASQLLRAVLESASAHDVPLLLDADALNLIAKDLSLLRAPHGPVIVTPHLGEMSRLTGQPVALIQSRLIAAAEDFAREYGVVCVLKDEHTVTAVPDGRIWLNCSGNAGLATAGSGDVLSGVTGALMAQGMPAENAAPFGAYLHGMAGDVMAKETGINGLMAGDLPEGVRRVLAGAQRYSRGSGTDKPRRTPAAQTHGNGDYCEKSS